MELLRIKQEVDSVLSNKAFGDFFKMEFYPVSIIPWSWYTGFLKLAEQCEKSKQSNLELQPMPLLDSLVLLETEKSYLKDPNKQKSYQNYQLKPNLAENEDFLVLPSPVGSLLYKTYAKGCPEIKRYNIKRSQSKNLCSVELYLKEIKFVLYSNDRTKLKS